MAIAPRDQTRRFGSLQVLVAPQRRPATAVGTCLTALTAQWRRNGSLAALWQAWPKVAGAQLAPHCRPLSLQAGVLWVGANHPQWLQALRFNRHQLLGALRGAGFQIRDLRFQHHHPAAAASPGSESEAEVWAAHPCRIDVHGLADCPRCGAPAPAGELKRWGHCSFCLRQDSAQ